MASKNGEGTPFIVLWVLAALLAVLDVVTKIWYCITLEYVADQPLSAPGCF